MTISLSVFHLCKKQYENLKSLKIFKSALFRQKCVFAPKSIILSPNWHVLSGVYDVNYFLGKFPDLNASIKNTKPTKNKIQILNFKLSDHIYA